MARTSKIAGISRGVVKTVSPREMMAYHRVMSWILIDVHSHWSSSRTDWRSPFSNLGGVQLLSAAALDRVIKAGGHNLAKFKDNPAKASRSRDTDCHNWIQLGHTTLDRSAVECDEWTTWNNDQMYDCNFSGSRLPVEQCTPQPLTRQWSKLDQNVAFCSTDEWQSTPKLCDLAAQL